MELNSEQITQIQRLSFAIFSFESSMCWSWGATLNPKALETLHTKSPETGKPRLSAFQDPGDNTPGLITWVY